MMSLQPFMGEFDDYRVRREGLKNISVAVALSILVHVAVMWWRPDLRFPASEIGKPTETIGPLSVQLVPRAPAPRTPPPSLALKEPRPAAPKAPRAKPTPPQRQKAPVLALKEPSREPSPQPSPPPAVAPAPTPAPAPPSGDLSSYIEARRRARGESAPATSVAPRVPPAPATEDDNSRANRIAAANLGLDRKPTFGRNTTPGGGIFSLQHITYDYAEFLFYGWNKDIRRNTTQLIEVRKENYPNIRVAVIAKMIAIIREYEDGDFTWESHRLGHNVVLSARLRDNAGLQDFLMQEFFEEERRLR